MNTPNTTPGRATDVWALPASAGAAGRARWVTVRVAAVMLGILPFVLLEAGLRGLNLGRPAENPDPFAGFNPAYPLFEQQGSVYRTARGRAPFIASQEFSAAKPPNGFRIFCFGGSTVFGHPWLGATAFPQWLELELAQSDPTHSWQAINCGGISYASYRIAPMVREVLQYQPDLIIVATGHNEFLENRTYTSLRSRSAVWAWLQEKAYSLHTVTLARRWFVRGLIGGNAGAPAPDPEPGPLVHTRLDYISGYASYHRDADWHRRVIAEYDESVRAIVSACRAARVPLLLVRLGSNLRDCPPFKSEHRAGLSPELEADWQAAFDLATAAETTDVARALEYYHAAAGIDAEYALLDYRIARLLDRSGRPAEALAYYQRARDQDICPLRITSALEGCLVRIATETRTPLVDAARLLAARSPDEIPGDDWYVDHVHPTIGGHQLIARALAAQLRESGRLAPSAVWPEEQRREAYERHLSDLGFAYFAGGIRRVGWLEEWAQRQRLAAEAVPVDARGYVRLAFLRIELGDDAAAAAALREATKRDPDVAEQIQQRAQQLVEQGRPERAAALLRWRD